MAKYKCLENCKHGNIVECKEDPNFDENTTFTDEEQYPACPKWKENK